MKKIWIILCLAFILIILTFGYYYYFANPKFDHDSRRKELFNEMFKSLSLSCTANSGESINCSDALNIVKNSSCLTIGHRATLNIDESCINGCNQITATWWFDLIPNEPKEGCNPACVVDLKTKTATVNWRCTGLQQ